MMILIEATDDIAVIDGVECRRWKGKSENGTDCHVFVHRIAVANDRDQKPFERELCEKLPPGRQPVDVAMVLP